MSEIADGEESTRLAVGEQETDVDHIGTEDQNTNNKDGAATVAKEALDIEVDVEAGKTKTGK